MAPRVTTSFPTQTPRGRSLPGVLISVLQNGLTRQGSRFAKRPRCVRGAKLALCAGPFIISFCKPILGIVTCSPYTKSGLCAFHGRFQFLFVQIAGSPLPAPVFGSTGFRFISQLATRLASVVGPAPPRSSGLLPNLESRRKRWRL